MKLILITIFAGICWKIYNRITRNKRTGKTNQANTRKSSKQGVLTKELSIDLRVPFPAICYFYTTAAGKEEYVKKSVEINVILEIEYTQPAKYLDLILSRVSKSDGHPAYLLSEALSEMLPQILDNDENNTSKTQKVFNNRHMRECFTKMLDYIKRDDNNRHGENGAKFKSIRINKLSSVVKSKDREQWEMLKLSIESPNEYKNKLEAWIKRDEAESKNQQIENQKRAEEKKFKDEYNNGKYEKAFALRHPEFCHAINWDKETRSSGFSTAEDEKANAEYKHLLDMEMYAPTVVIPEIIKKDVCNNIIAGNITDNTVDVTDKILYGPTVKILSEIYISIGKIFSVIGIQRQWENIVRECAMVNSTNQLSLPKLLKIILQELNLSGKHSEIKTIRGQLALSLAEIANKVDFIFRDNLIDIVDNTNPIGLAISTYRTNPDIENLYAVFQSTIQLLEISILTSNVITQAKKGNQHFYNVFREKLLTKDGIIYLEEAINQKFLPESLATEFVHKLDASILHPQKTHLHNEIERQDRLLATNAISKKSRDCVVSKCYDLIEQINSWKDEKKFKFNAIAELIGSVIYIHPQIPEDELLKKGLPIVCSAKYCDLGYKDDKKKAHMQGMGIVTPDISYFFGPDSNNQKQYLILTHTPDVSLKHMQSLIESIFTSLYVATKGRITFHILDEEMTTYAHRYQSMLPEGTFNLFTDRKEFYKDIDILLEIAQKRLHKFGSVANYVLNHNDLYPGNLHVVMSINHDAKLKDQKVREKFEQLIQLSSKSYILPIFIDPYPDKVIDKYTKEELSGTNIRTNASNSKWYHKGEEFLAPISMNVLIPHGIKRLQDFDLFKSIPHQIDSHDEESIHQIESSQRTAEIKQHEAELQEIEKKKAAAKEQLSQLQSQVRAAKPEKDREYLVTFGYESTFNEPYDKDASWFRCDILKAGGMNSAHMTLSTYNSLLAGGEEAIENFIKMNFFNDMLRMANQKKNFGMTVFLRNVQMQIDKNNYI